MTQPENATYKVKVNAHTFSVSQEQIDAIDARMIQEDQVHLLVDGKSVLVHIIDVDHSGKKITLSLEGETMQVKIAGHLDVLLREMGFGRKKTKHTFELRAPMPGLVQKIMVKEGDTCVAGQSVLILEAMKMENSMSVIADCVIKSVKVRSGEPVEKGQLLIEMNES